MKAKLLQMGSVKTTAESFHRTVETIEPRVNFEIRSISDEYGSCRMCEVTLPNQEGAKGRLCVALLSPEHVNSLIEALDAWKALP